MDADARTIAHHNLRMAAEAGRLQQLFAAAELPVTFFKGAALAVLAYQNLALRQSKDIDLLVPPDSLLAAAATLESAGYRRVDPPELDERRLGVWIQEQRHFIYTHGQSGIEVELHWRLFRNPHLVPALEAAPSCEPVAVSDGIKLPALAGDDLFAYLCAHGASHSWFRLKWLADVGALLAQGPPAEVEQRFRAAAVRNVGVPAAQAILLCQRLLGTDVPEPLVAFLRAGARVRWLERTAMIVITAPPADMQAEKARAGVKRESLAQVLLLPSWRYSIAELRTLLVTPEDIKTLSPRERISVAYLLVRLWRWVWWRIRLVG